MHFWLVGIEGQTTLCVGMTRAQVEAFVAEHNAFYKSINFADMDNLRIMSPEPGDGYCAACKRFRVLDASLTFHEVFMFEGKGGGTYVGTEGSRTWEELKQCELELLRDLEAEGEEDGVILQ